MKKLKEAIAEAKTLLEDIDISVKYDDKKKAQSAIEFMRKNARKFIASVAPIVNSDGSVRFIVGNSRDAAKVKKLVAPTGGVVEPD